MFKPQKYDSQALIAKLKSTMFLDDVGSAFVANDLVQKDPRLFNIEYANLEALSYLPINTNFHPGVQTLSYKQYDSRAVAEISSDFASASPSAKTAAAEYFSGVVTVRSSCYWSIDEIRAAQFQGTPLEEMDMMAARRAINEKLDAIAMNGSAEHNIFGLTNIPNVGTSANAPGDEWDSTTADPMDIALDIISFLQAIQINTKGLHRANTLIMPQVVLNDIAARPVDTTSGVSVLEYVQKRFAGLQVYGSFVLTDSAIAYDKNPLVLELALPVPFERLQDDVEATKIVREMRARTGGVRGFLPKAIQYRTNVAA